MLIAGSALAMYVALMGGYIAGFSPIAYALFSALVLALGLCFYAWQVRLLENTNGFSPARVALPSLSESMDELYALQMDINELQTQFAAENAVRGGAADQDSSASK